ncbi:sugar ABC transporter substrate-binding protein [Labrys monachus]|uniref:Ribose transport system substrate-binding protein n=1 Tax=Labrys monachus TaxID=217067 RepID=A0ABU0FHB4_9HYPH|nr:substrate-binding domain-containing protein [Labrys monachus]MDQ0393985.1 ribose transport system substrate-binding protein [Labrys monachus]
MKYASVALAASIVAGSFGLIAGSSPVMADDLSYFEKQLEPYRAKPSFVAPGPSFDAPNCMKGKSILSIPVSSANPFTANIEKAMQAVAKDVGFKFTTWENQGQSSQWVQGMDTALNQKVSLIDLLAGSDPRVLVPQVKAAQAAKIPVIASHYNGVEQTSIVNGFADGDVPIDYFKAGSLLVDWAMVSTKGKLNALVLIASGPLSTDSMVAGINAELKHCDGCKTKTLNYTVPDWGTRITPGVQAALLADPTINYVIVIYDSMAQFVVPAITITGSQDRVKVDAFNGTPFVLGLVQAGQVEMDIGENLDWIGHSILDSEMRRVCGLPLVSDPKIPFLMFTKDNAKDAGTPPQLSQGYGDAYVKGFHDLWQLK